MGPTQVAAHFFGFLSERLLDVLIALSLLWITVDAWLRIRKHASVAPLALLAQAGLLGCFAFAKNWIVLAVALSVFVIERIFPRRAALTLSPAAARGAIHATITLALNLVVFSLFLRVRDACPPRWGMEAHGVPFWIQCITCLVVVDAWLSLRHYLQHRIPFWWRFHRPHHVTLELSWLATSRSHVIEYFLCNGVVSLSLVYLLGAAPKAFLLGFVLPASIMQLVQHANFDFPRADRPLPWYGYVLGLSNTHALHHERDAVEGVNFGITFLWIDHLLGTFRKPGSVPPREFGVASEPAPEQISYIEEQLRPFLPERAPP